MGRKATEEEERKKRRKAKKKRYTWRGISKATRTKELKCPQTENSKAKEPPSSTNVLAFSFLFVCIFLRNTPGFRAVKKRQERNKKDVRAPLRGEKKENARSETAPIVFQE